MKLSEAIRKGAKMRPKGTGDLFDRGGRSCALGAAYEAVFGYPGHNCNFTTEHGGEQMGNRLRSAFPVLSQHTGHGLYDEVVSMVWHLNDTKEWSREEIADWIEREYESKLPQKERETDDAYTKRVIGEIVATSAVVVAVDARLTA